MERGSGEAGSAAAEQWEWGGASGSWAGRRVGPQPAGRPRGRDKRSGTPSASLLPLPSPPPSSFPSPFPLPSPLRRAWAWRGRGGGRALRTRDWWGAGPRPRPRPIIFQPRSAAGSVCGPRAEGRVSQVPLVSPPLSAIGRAQLVSSPRSVQVSAAWPSPGPAPGPGPRRSCIICSRSRRS